MPLLPFGENFRKAREKRGLSREEVAVRLGCSAQSIWQYESGNRLPKPMALPLVARVLGVSIDWLLGATDQEPDWGAHSNAPQHPEVPEGYAERERREHDEHRKQNRELLDIALDGTKKGPND